MKTQSLAMLAVLLCAAQAEALAADTSRSSRDRSADKAEAAAVAATKPAAEDWGIWNRAPRRAGRDPLLALGQRDRAPNPEPIDAAVRSDPADRNVDNGEIDLNLWDSGRITLPPPPKPDDGT